MPNAQSAIRDPRLILLAGPTAVGKSEVALLLADRLGGEIISVDSMQVYRGLDIGTAKPSKEEHARVRHHLIDIVDLAESFDAAQFVRLAGKAVEEIRNRKRVPILCGGTGLYFKAFLEGLGAAPPADTTLRNELQITPLPNLLIELAAKDPVTYERIDRDNPRRVIRALEVIRLTGKPYSQQRADWSESRLEIRAGALTCLKRSSADLAKRISTRVDEMFRRGLVRETEELLKHGLAENRTAMQALGYRQVAEHLRGARSLSETVELVKIRTRQFAKRQMTWFRKYGAWDWINLNPDESVDLTVQRLLERM